MIHYNGCGCMKSESICDVVARVNEEVERGLLVALVHPLDYVHLVLETPRYAVAVVEATHPSGVKMRALDLSTLLPKLSQRVYALGDRELPRGRAKVVTSSGETLATIEF